MLDLLGVSLTKTEYQCQCWGSLLSKSNIFFSSNALNYMQLHYMHTDVSPEAVKGNKESGTASFLKLFTW